MLRRILIALLAVTVAALVLGGAGLDVVFCAWLRAYRLYYHLSLSVFAGVALVAMPEGRQALLWRVLVWAGIGYAGGVLAYVVVALAAPQGVAGFVNTLRMRSGLLFVGAMPVLTFSWVQVLGAHFLFLAMKGQGPARRRLEGPNRD